MDLLKQRLQDLYSQVVFFCIDPFSAKQRAETIQGINFNIRGGTSDFFVLREVFKENVYQVKPRGVVFDVGANIGAYSLYAAQTADQVYSFEPESSNYEQLMKNISANTFTNITAFKKAVGGHEGSSLLSKPKINKGHSSTAVRVSNDTEEVEMFTLKTAVQLCGVDHIDLLKIDIEGSEYDIFANVGSETLYKIDQIVMEVHHVKGKNLSELVKTLEEAHFIVRCEQKFFEHLFFGVTMLFAKRA